MAFCARTAPAAGQRRPHEDALALASGSWLLTSSDKKGALRQSDQGALLLQGSIANVSELRKALGLGSRGPRNPGTVLLASLDRWGPSALGLVQGHWSFLYWDRRGGRLLAARDLRGAEALFYRYDGTSLAFANSLEDLQGLAPLAPNDEALAAFLIRGEVPPGSTFFKDIWELEPGHLLEADLRKKTFQVSAWKKLHCAPWSSWDAQTALEIEDQCRQALDQELTPLPGPLAVPVENLLGAWMATAARRARREVTALVRDRWGLQAAQALGLPWQAINTSPAELLFSLEELSLCAGRPLSAPALSLRRFYQVAAAQGHTLWDPLGGAELLIAPQHWYRSQLLQMVLAGDGQELKYSWDHLQDRFLRGKPHRDPLPRNLFTPESRAMAMKFSLPRLNLNRKVLNQLARVDFLRRERRDLAASCGAAAAFPFADSTPLAETLLGASPVYRIHGGNGSRLFLRLTAELPRRLPRRIPNPEAGEPEWAFLKIFPAVLLRWIPKEMEQWVDLKVLGRRWKDLALRCGPAGLETLWRIAAVGLWLRSLPAWQPRPRGPLAGLKALKR